MAIMIRFLASAVVLIALSELAIACSDLYPISYCAPYRSQCHFQSIAALCKKTCGKCGGGGILPPKTAGPIIPTRRPTSGKCGVPMYSSSRVIAGTRASAGAWPWQVRLLNNGRGGCGGTLVAPRWVVTASHCVSKNPSPFLYQIQVGATNLGLNENSRKNYPVRRVIMHPQYSSRTFNNDITLIELSQPVQFNKYVQPACLPRQGEQVAIGTQCYITGFGKTRHPGSGSSVLMQTSLPVVSQSTCGRLNTATTRLQITSQMLCAGYGPSRRESGCHGDSGGPFVCRNSQGGFTLQGAVSWGSGTCSSREAYTVFAKVAQFRSWIDKYVK